MMKKIQFFILVFSLLMLTGCGTQKDDGILRTEESHTFDGYPVVYITPDVSAEGLLAAYKALEAPDVENIVIQLSDTETDNGFQWVGFMGELSQMLEKPAIAEGHSAADFSDADCTIIVSHFRSHDRVGFNGAIKQTAMLSASDSAEKISCSAGGLHRLEGLAEAGKRTVEDLSGHILYISVMDRLSIESAASPLPDSNTYQIGILSSYDPVALDQACVDFVYMIKEGAPFAAHIAEQNGSYTLAYAEKIGLGSRTYALSVIND